MLTFFATNLIVARWAGGNKGRKVHPPRIPPKPHPAYTSVVLELLPLYKLVIFWWNHIFYIEWWQELRMVQENFVVEFCNFRIPFSTKFFFSFCCWQHSTTKNVVTTVNYIRQQSTIILKLLPQNKRQFLYSIISGKNIFYYNNFCMTCLEPFSVITNERNACFCWARWLTYRQNNVGPTARLLPLVLLLYYYTMEISGVAGGNIVLLARVHVWQ